MQTYLLYRGNEKLKIKNTICLPVEDFLFMLNKNNYHEQ